MKNKFLFLDLVGGISGDMLVGGLIDLGVPFEVVSKGIEKLNNINVSVTVKKEKRHSISGVKFCVETASKNHPHRSFKSVKELINESANSESVKKLAIMIFEKLAVAEARVHDYAVENVHFHEVGAWDSIADIVGISLCLDYLRIDDIYVSQIPTGRGTVKGAHGVMPVPAPATSFLLEGFEIINDSLRWERTTPTGAAVLAAMAKPVPSEFNYVIEKTGIGIGTKDDPDISNIIRCIIGIRKESYKDSNLKSEDLVCSETNLDDCNPEWLGYVQERLFSVGALDVWFIPIQMKKNRPGVLLQVLHLFQKQEIIHQILFEETPTLGIRYSSWKRNILERKIIDVESPWGIVRGKIVEFNIQKHFTPEYDDCRSIAVNHNIPLKTVYQTVENCFYKNN